MWCMRWQVFQDAVRRILHIHNEGAPFRSGVNFTFGRWWLRVTWVAVDFYDYTAAVTSIRFRLLPHTPKVYYSKKVGSIIEWFLTTHNCFLISQELAEDSNLTWFPGGNQVYPKNPPKTTFRRV